MSFKSRYLEAENARLRERERIYIACLLERAGHRSAAEMIQRNPEEPIPAAVVAVAGIPAEKPAAMLQRPSSRSWRTVKTFLENLTKPEEKKEESANV